MTITDTTAPMTPLPASERVVPPAPTILNAEELRAIIMLLDRVSTKGIREAGALVQLVTKLQKMLEEAAK